MCLDANRDMTHAEMQRKLFDCLSPQVDWAYTEFRLPNGRIADLLMQFEDYKIVIEVKTVLKESLFLNAFHKYSKYCDMLVLASPPQLVHQDLDIFEANWVNPAIIKMGIWWVTWDGITAIRLPAILHKEKTARSKRNARFGSHPAVIGSPACTAGKP